MGAHLPPSVDTVRSSGVTSTLRHKNDETCYEDDVNLEWKAPVGEERLLLQAILNCRKKWDTGDDLRKPGQSMCYLPSLNISASLLSHVASPAQESHTLRQLSPSSIDLTSLIFLIFLLFLSTFEDSTRHFSSGCDATFAAASRVHDLTEDTFRRPCNM